VLVVSAGKFRRWKVWPKLTAACLKRCAHLRADGNAQQVRDVLKPDHKVLFIQATESSTGVRHDVEGIARLVKDTDTLLVRTPSPGWHHAF